MCRSDGVFALWLATSFFPLTLSKKSYSGVIYPQEDSPSNNVFVSTMAFQRFQRFMSVQFRTALPLTATPYLQLRHMLSNELHAYSSRHSYHCTTGLSNNIVTFTILTDSVAMSSKSRPLQCARSTSERKRRKRTTVRYCPVQIDRCGGHYIVSH